MEEQPIERSDNEKQQKGVKANSQIRSESGGKREQSMANKSQ